MSPTISAEMEGELAHELAAHQEAAGPAQEEMAGGHGGHGHGAQAEIASQVFFNHLTAMADRGGRSQALRRIALAAARRALRSYRPEEGIEGEGEAGFAAHEFALEGELNPVRQLYGDAVLEHLGHSAAEAESELEAAEQFLPAVPIAARVIVPMLMRNAPAAARAATRVIAQATPALTRAVGQVAGALYRSPVVRPLVRALPGIVRGTVADIARQVARGRPVTAQGAVRALARQTARQLGDPRRLVRVYRASNARDRRYHRTVSRITGVPLPGRTATAPATVVIGSGGGNGNGYRGSVATHGGGGYRSTPTAGYVNGNGNGHGHGRPGFAVPTTYAGSDGTVCRCHCGPR